MAVVTANYIPRGKFAKQQAMATLGYNAERPGKDAEEISRLLFGWQGAFTEKEAKAMILQAPKGTIFFRVMISPDPNGEDIEKGLDMQAVVRKAYEELEKKLKMEGKLQFIAALHADHRAHRHIHSLLLVPHWLTKEQFRAIAYTPREAATREASRQAQQDLPGLLQQQERHHPKALTAQPLAGAAGGRARGHRSAPPLCEDCLRPLRKGHWRDCEKRRETLFQSKALSLARGS